MNKLKRKPSYGLGNVLLKKAIKFFPKLGQDLELKKAKELSGLLARDENILLKAQDDMYNQYTSPEFKNRVSNLVNNRESKRPSNRYFDLNDENDLSKFDKSSDYIIAEAERRLNPFTKGNQISYFTDKEAKLTSHNAEYLPDAYVESTKRIDPSEDLINRSKVKRTLTNDRKRFAAIHELTHQATDADSLLNSNVKQELQKPFYLSINSPTLKKYKTNSELTEEIEHLNYLTEPTEIHARINQIRHELNPGNPYKKLEYSDIKTIKELKEGQRLVELIQDEKGFIDLMNKMYTPAAIAAAGTLGLTVSQGEYKKGGTLKLKFQSGGPLKHNNKAPDSFEAKFNTKLSKDVEEAYNRHTEAFPQLKGDKWDYDTQGFYKEIYENNNGDFEAITKALTPGSPTAHVGTDKFKKPNHPTFSKESKYYIPILRRAGEWGKDEDGKDQFKAVRRNIKNMDNDPLSYFKRAEDYDQDGTPDVSLLFRNKKLFQNGGSSLFQEGEELIKNDKAKLWKSLSPFEYWLRTLPDNLRYTDQKEFDMLAWWESMGKPKDWQTTKTENDLTKDPTDGKYHARSREPISGKSLKKLGHNALQYHLEMDEKGGYLPYTDNAGNFYTLNEEEYQKHPLKKELVRTTLLDEVTITPTRSYKTPKDEKHAEDIPLSKKGSRLKFKSGGSLKDFLPCNKPQRAAAGKS